MEWARRRRGTASRYVLIVIGAFLAGVVVAVVFFWLRPPGDEVGVANLDLTAEQFLCGARPSDCDKIRQRDDVKEWRGVETPALNYFKIVYNALSPKSTGTPFCIMAEIYNGPPAGRATMLVLATPTPSASPRPPPKLNRGTTKRRAGLKSPPARKPNATVPKPKSRTTSRPKPQRMVASAPTPTPSTPPADLPSKQLVTLPSLPANASRETVRDATVTYDPAVRDTLQRLDTLAVASMNRSITQIGTPGNPSVRRLVSGTQCYRKRLNQLAWLENAWYHGELTCRSQWVVDDCDAALRAGER
ncbi:MAG: hypothetical protein JO152_17275 [Mycobacteriaceae bacterium]|nr:hypothetical protein [Mycobacteriaceae bacterium]